MSSSESLPSNRIALQESGLPAAPFYESPPQGPADDESGGDASITIKRSIAALLRYKWLIMGIVVVTSTAGFFVRGWIPAQYQAEGKVWIAQSVPGPQGPGGPVRAEALLPTNSNSWSDLVSSSAVIERTVREQHLFIRAAKPWDDELFASAEADDRTIRPGSYVLRVDPSGKNYALSAGTGTSARLIEKGSVGDSIGRPIGLQWAPQAGGVPKLRTVSFSLTTPRQAVLQVKGQVTSLRTFEGNVLRVVVTGSDGPRAARTANSLERQLVATADEFKRRNLTEVRKTLEVQAAYAQRALQAADDALERFRMQTITLPSEAGTPINGGVTVSRSPVISNFFNLKLARENVAQERQTLQQTLQDIAAGKVEVQALWQVLPTTGGGPEVGALLTEYTKKQSELRNQLATFTEDYQGVKETRAALAQLKDHAIPGVVNTLTEQLKRQQADLDDQINSASTSLQEIPARTIEEVRLTRDVEARTTLYGMLQSRYEEAHLAELSVQPDLSILDSASTPEVPISSRGRQFFLMTIVGGFAGAAVLALLLDRFDKRIRYVQQVPTQLKLNVVGAVPHVVRRTTPDALNVAQLVESFRSLRLGISYAIPRQRPLTLTITSAGPAEGKSFVSSNLALAFAESGYRTLLIDGDVRRGTLHRVFNTERRPGLVEVLRGESTLASCSRATTHPYLSLLSSGARLKTAPELLASESFRTLMETARPAYDVILIDSPPLAAGMDPHALCVATGNVLFVVRLAESDGEVARQKLDLLERFPVRVIGAVANDVTASVGLNGEYSYLAAYTIHDEDALSEHTSVTAVR